MDQQVIIVNRTNIVQNVLDKIGNIDPLKPIRVIFEEEDGIDGGALTTALYNEFFKNIFDEKHNLFKKSENGTHYLPKEDSNDLKKFEMFGRVLVRLLIDERIVSVPLTPSVLKYLREKPLESTMRDLEVYDVDMHRQLLKILAFPGVEQFGLDFDELCAGGEDIQVNDTNKQKYVSLKVKNRID